MHTNEISRAPNGNGRLYRNAIARAEILLIRYNIFTENRHNNSGCGHFYKAHYKMHLIFTFLIAQYSQTISAIYCLHRKRNEQLVKCEMKTCQWKALAATTYCIQAMQQSTDIYIISQKTYKQTYSVVRQIFGLTTVISHTITQTWMTLKGNHVPLKTGIMIETNHYNKTVSIHYGIIHVNLHICRPRLHRRTPLVSFLWQTCTCYRRENA